MERYIAQGIANDIADERQVVVFPAPYDTVQNILYQVSEYTADSYTTVSHAESNIRDVSGGTLSVLHDVEKLRGRKVDVLIVPDGMDTEAFRFYLKPDTELIRY